MDRSFLEESWHPTKSRPPSLPPFLPIISLPFPTRYLLTLSSPPSPSLIASPLLTYRWLGRYNRSDRSWYGVRRCGRMGGRGCRLCVSIDVIGRCVWPSVGGWGWVCRIWDCGWDIGVWGWVWVWVGGYGCVGVTFSGTPCRHLAPTHSFFAFYTYSRPYTPVL